MISFEVLKAYVWISEYFTSCEIPYVVIGGMAASLYGSPRDVVDIDIGVPNRSLSKINSDLHAFVKEDYSSGYDGLVWKLELIVFEKDHQIVDIFGYDEVFVSNGKNPVWYQVSFNSVTKVQFGELSIPVIDVDELKKYKEILSRDVDLADLKYL